MATERQAWPPCHVALSLPQTSLFASWRLCFRVREVSGSSSGSLRALPTRASMRIFSLTN